MAGKRNRPADNARPDPRGKASGGEGGNTRKKRTAGNPSYAGYEYQISVTIWVALDLLLAKGVTETLVVEPVSEEDIEAAVVAPDEALLGVETKDYRFELVVQIKSKSTGPWTTKELADVLTGKQDGEGKSGSGARARPLALLTADSTRRYVFITNEGLQSELRPHSGEHLFDFPEVDTLPPFARKGYDAAAQALIAPRILLCPGVTNEVLDARITRLLALHGHVPLANHNACIRDLRDGIRRRLKGYASGRWTKADLLEVLARHGGSVLPTRAMDHYVQPQSYAAIRHCLDERHAVVIKGPSGTGKTLTADIIEMELRQAEVPFDVVGGEHGPGHVRSQLSRTDPVLFHLRDPWGSNRLTPDADRWSDELPKLLRNAGPGRKFLITSRSDILLSAGHRLAQELTPYSVAIEIEDYGKERLAEIYDRISSDLSGHASALARANRDRALSTLTRPYEIDRFLIALSREDPNATRRMDEILSESQIDTISRVIADQIAAWGSDGVAGAAIVWAMLSARSAVAVEVFPKLLRSLRAIDPTLRPDVVGLIDFLVAGRNLRQDGAALSFYHPRVEDGLRMAMLSRKGEAEYVLSGLADALAAWDLPVEDWGIETVLGILRSTAKLDDIELTLADRTHSRLDAYLQAAAFDAPGQNDFERALTDLARFGSADYAPSRLARLLVPVEPETEWTFFGKRWIAPSLGATEVTALGSDPRTQSLLERFIRDVLPFSRTRYHTGIVPLLAQLGRGLVSAFSDALDTILELDGPGENIDAVVAGVLSDDVPTFDGVIDRIAKAEAEVDAWMDREYKGDARRAEEHEVDAAYADHILDEPSERYFNTRSGMEAVVRLRRTREGLGWVTSHPHRQLVVSALADSFAHDRHSPSADELRLLLGAAEGWARGRVWLAVAQHWDVSLSDLLETELARTDLQDKWLRKTLVEIAAKFAGPEGDPIAVLVSIAAATSLERRLEMVRDVMEVRLNIDPRGDDASRERRARTERLVETFPSPEAELGRALANLLAGGDILTIGEALTDSARSLLSGMISTAPASIVGPLICLAAAAGIEITSVADHLLAGDEIENGQLAVQALVINGSPAAWAAIEGALKHSRYPVRRDALNALVDRTAPEDRTRLLAAADDPSADVRLAWAELMQAYTWPEAVDSLVDLLRDRRDFGYARVHGITPSWAEFKVARAAVRALGAYDELPGRAVDALLAAASDTQNPDPFVACWALSALAKRVDDRIVPALKASLFSAGLTGAPDYRPAAQAASWALLDRANAGMPGLDDPILLQVASRDSAEVAGPLLIAFGIVGGPEREALLSSLDDRGLGIRTELVWVAAAAANRLPADGTLRIYQLLARLTAGESLESLNPADRDELITWSGSLDLAVDVQRYTAVLAAQSFNLPVREIVADPREFRLPTRIGVLTTRSLSPAREEYSGLDDGT